MTHNKMEVLHFIAHTMAQESLNNISPWFTEGFAKFLEIYVIDKVVSLTKRIFLPK